MKQAILNGYTKTKKRDLFWQCFIHARSEGKETSHMLEHAERLLEKKDRAIQLFNRHFEQ